MTSPVTAPRDLPRVDEMLAVFRPSGLPRALLVDLARLALDRARSEIAQSGASDPKAIMGDQVQSALMSRGRRVINATGVLLHTNLGRARLSASAIETMTEAAAGYTSLELDLSSGDRGRRGGYVETLLELLTGAEAALIVNNNAAGLLLALTAMAAGKAVVVSRGELIEIGGSYRLPSIMEVSGARLVEVGTTNRTRLGDYATAIQINDVGAILKVHPSNYRVHGFTEETDLASLAALSRDSDIALIHDVGSGLLDRDASWLGQPPPEWLRDEPSVTESVAHGADLVTFSGDKLLGGPQAGIIVGTRPAVERLRSHPLTRALRADGITYAALGATLEAHADGHGDQIPFWRMALASEDALSQRTTRIAESLGGLVERGQALIGAGSVPETGIPGPRIVLPGEGELFLRLLWRQPAVLARRVAGDLVIDLRAVDEEETPRIAEAVVECR